MSEYDAIDKTNWIKMIHYNNFRFWLQLNHEDCMKSWVGKIRARRKKYMQINNYVRRNGKDSELQRLSVITVEKTNASRYHTHYISLIC